MSFKLKTCSSAGVVLLSRNCFWPLYKIKIGGLKADSYIMRFENPYYRVCKRSAQQVPHCDTNADFFITWDDYTITVGLGLESNGSVFLTCTSDTNQWPFEFVNIRIQSRETADWTLYDTSGRTINCLNGLFK